MIGETRIPPGIRVEEIGEVTRLRYRPMSRTSWWRLAIFLVVLPLTAASLWLVAPQSTGWTAFTAVFLGTTVGLVLLYFLANRTYVYVRRDRIQIRSVPVPIPSRRCILARHVREIRSELKQLHVYQGSTYWHVVLAILKGGTSVEILKVYEEDQASFIAERIRERLVLNAPREPER